MKVIKIKGRALVWNLRRPSEMVFLDRIYTHAESDLKSIQRLCKKKVWFYKSNNNHTSIEYLVDPDGNKETGELIVKVKKGNYDKYPYLDTLKWYTPSNGTLSTESGDIELEDTDGRWVGAEDDCDNCGGNGRVYCYECDGNGEVSCRECDGDGEVDCLDCDGDGEVDCDTCDGSGEVDCDYCDGNGEDSDGESCVHCDGSGKKKCDDCSGSGKIPCSNCDESGKLLVLIVKALVTYPVQIVMKKDELIVQIVIK
jgi:uncharacterized membrane protein YkoI